MHDKSKNNKDRKEGTIKDLCKSKLKYQKEKKDANQKWCLNLNWKLNFIVLKSKLELIKQESLIKELNKTKKLQKKRRKDSQVCWCLKWSPTFLFIERLGEVWLWWISSKMKLFIIFIPLFSCKIEELSQVIRHYHSLLKTQFG